MTGIPFLPLTTMVLTNVSFHRRPCSRAWTYSIACFLEKHEELVGRLANGGGEVVLFGFCIGGCYAHEFARILVERHDINVRLVIFDGHPAEWYLGTGARDLFRKTKKVLQIVRAKGRIERSLVRQGRRQLHLLGKHVSVELDVPALLLRSNSIEESWGLSQEAWQPFVRECQQVDIPDLSHLDLFQRRMGSTTVSLP